MRIHNSNAGSVISDDQLEILNSKLSASSTFFPNISEPSFQQVINNNSQDQASALLMFLIGDPMQNGLNLEPFFDKKQTQENFESKQLPVKKKRCQVRNACVNCQKSNKKCDEARPCSRCIKHDLFDSCINSKRKKRQKGIKRGPYRRKNQDAHKIQMAQPMNMTAPLLETLPTPNIDTFIPDFTGQPLLNFNQSPRFFMQPLPTPPLDTAVPCSSMPLYEDETIQSSITLTDPFNRYPTRNIDNMQGTMPAFLGNGSMNNMMSHLLENQIDLSCRPLSMGHETDLGALASLCATVLSEE
ncbi:hypothetical protein PORY_000502 [Pneumocystis oryctolagi]|uniref:Uncharacterized protein n=1 Tax=Pneumocystis oryctolagi TaxID=42067 RepID=A0ACB7CJJ7_9ASCO|nr:hypothetical protein PORY_000502 [Pneumocystis oryctolagi]